MILTVSLSGTVILGGAAASLLLAVVALAQRPRGRLHWTFGLGMIGFAAEALSAFVLLSATELPEDRLRWLQNLEITGLGLLVPWGAFVVSLVGNGRNGARGANLALAAGALGLPLASWAVVALPVFQISDIPGPFYAARFDPVGQYAVVLQPLAT